jgi:hypothetical protein
VLQRKSVPKCQLGNAALFLSLCVDQKQTKKDGHDHPNGKILLSEDLGLGPTPGNGMVGMSSY